MTETRQRRSTRTPSSRSPTAKTHFTPELFRFLRALERHNDREWFHRHRAEYREHVRDPMLRFIEDLAPRLRRVSRQFIADPSPVGGSMFRIHRDMRFATDGRPYKTMAAAQFRHVRGRDVHAPGFYLHLGTDAVFAGAGLWRPDGAALQRLRGHLVEHPDEWRRLQRRKAFREGGLRLAGESLKRPPRGFDPEHPLVEDLKRKDFVVVLDLDERAACDAGFLDRYVDFCRSAAPFVRLITDGLGLPW